MWNDIEQARLLEEATLVVREQSALMNHAIENNVLRDVLKYASNILCELRTSTLSPKSYYELYMLIFHEVRYMVDYFSDTSKHGRTIEDLYESVQHAGNIIPRLYLLICVGVCYMQTHSVPASEILRDLTELCKGVQNPIRGLFLRYFLIQMCKDKLPDIGSPYSEGEDGTVDEAFEFLLTNFYESSRLWVRLQYQGQAKDRDRREKERHEMRVLVGANLVRMALLDGMTCDYYKSKALPKILEHILNCKDDIAQHYLLDCIIQVFSDECHLATLDTLLNAFTRTLPTVDIKSIFLNLTSRLTNFIEATNMEDHKEIVADNSQQILSSVQVFEKFENFIKSLLRKPVLGEQVSNLRDYDLSDSEAITERMDVGSCLELLAAFMSFTLAVYPTEPQYVYQILDEAIIFLNRVVENTPSITKSISNSFVFARNKLEDSSHSETSTTPASQQDLLGNDSNEDGGKQYKVLVDKRAINGVVEIISLPLRTFSIRILEGKEFSTLMSFTDVSVQKRVSASMLESVLISGFAPPDYQYVDRFLNFISPLLSSARHSKKSHNHMNKADMDDYTNIYNHNKYKKQSEEDDFCVSCDESEDESDGESGNVKYSKQKKVGYETLEICMKNLCKLIILFKNHDVDVLFAMYCRVADMLENSGPQRHKIVLPTICMCSFKLIETLLEKNPLERKTKKLLFEEKSESENIKFTTLKKVFQFLHRIGTTLTVSAPEEAIRIFLYTATLASQVDLKMKKLSLLQEELCKLTNVHVNEEGNLYVPLATALTLVDSNEILVPQVEQIFATCLVGLKKEMSGGPYEAICFEFLTQAMVCFEEEINNGKKQYDNILYIIGTMCNLPLVKQCLPDLQTYIESCDVGSLEMNEFEQQFFSPNWRYIHEYVLNQDSENCVSQALDAENFNTVTSKIISHCAKLLKRNDRGRALIFASHMFHDTCEGHKDNKKVIDCLHKCLKVVDPAFHGGSTKQCSLLPMLLEEYYYYYKCGNELMTQKLIECLILMCETHVSENEFGKNYSAMQHYTNLMQFLKRTDLKHLAAS